MRTLGSLLLLFLLTLSLTASCGSGDEGATGAACAQADDCYADVDRDNIAGDIICLDRVTDGYCTHLCTSDEDCCKADGECPGDFEVVCAPFESTGDKYCFVSCEGVDDEAHCTDNAGDDFSCRSTGGGSENRKVCLP